MKENPDLAAVIDLENRRIAAVNDGDVNTIDQLLSEDCTQVHANGRIDNKASLLDLERTTRRTIEPRNPDVRLYGNVAILTGPALHHAIVDGAPVEYRIYTTQVAVKQNGKWRFAAVQATMICQ
jgi:ketosteroid isomerase-like protein